MFSKVLRYSFTLFIATFLLACGGGGGGGSSYVAPSVTSTSYSGNVQTKTYSNGTTATNLASSQNATYASDHITRTTTYSYSDGGSNSVVDTVSPTVALPTYSGGFQSIVTTYGDGSTVTATAGATSTVITWAPDHVTKTTVYGFANGGTNSVVATVPGVAGTPAYAGNQQTIVTTYGDGSTSTAVNTATSTVVTWASDHITKTTTYTFANGGTNPVVATIAPTVSTPALTSAVYPGNWTTTGTVLPPTVSAKINTYGDGYSAVTEDGTSAKPFNQSTLAALSITDPSKYVTSPTATYNLNWGIPDKMGPTYVSLFPNLSTHLTSNLNYMGVVVAGQGVVGPTLVQPSGDVLAAWANGWTGKGANLMTIDDYSTIGTCNSAITCHGITTMMISDLIAPGAAKFALDWNGASPAQKMDGTTLTTSTNMHVVNMSFGSNAGFSANVVNFLTGVSPIANVGVTNSVLTKSAGNNGGQDTYSYTGGGDYLVKALVDNSNTLSRLLVVGALNKNGTVASKATIASYSNVAGANVAAQNRFVVANGNAPYANGGVSMNGSNIAGYNSSPTNYGTSYAAPVVAGYAAILTQKFPNLSASSTSNIILDTARTDTLTCSPNCDPAIYGKGEASLSRALAPVGRLR